MNYYWVNNILISSWHDWVVRFILFDIVCWYYLGDTPVDEVVVPFFDCGFCIFGTLAALSGKLFNDIITITSLSLQLHPSLLPSQAFHLNFAWISSRCRCYFAECYVSFVKLLLSQVFLIFAIFNVNRKSLRRQEPEPLQGLRVKPDLCEGILPMRQPKMHDH